MDRKVAKPHSSSCWVTTMQDWANGSHSLKRLKSSTSSRTLKVRFLIWSRSKTTSILTSPLSYFRSWQGHKTSSWPWWTLPTPKWKLRRKRSLSWVRPYLDSKEESKNTLWWEWVRKKRKRVKRIDLVPPKILNTKWLPIQSSTIVLVQSQSAEFISPMPTKSRSIKYCQGNKLTTKWTMKRRLNTWQNIWVRM